MNFPEDDYCSVISIPAGDPISQLIIGFKFNYKLLISTFEKRKKSFS